MAHIYIRSETYFLPPPRHFIQLSKTQYKKRPRFLFEQQELLIRPRISLSLPGSILVRLNQNRLAKQACRIEKYTSEASLSLSLNIVYLNNAYRAKRYSVSAWVRF